MNKVVVLYSGGLDSSVVATHLASQGYKVYLLAVDNGVSHYLELSKIKYRYMKRRYRNIRKLIIADATYLFKKYLIERLEEDIRRYKYNLICVGCKLIMYFLAAAVGKIIGSNIIADGYSKRQDSYPEQKLEVMKIYANILNRYGFRIIHPIYYVKDIPNIKALSIKYGIPPKSIEPLCMFGNSFSHNIPINVIMNYLQDKYNLMKNELEELFEARWWLKSIIT